MQPSLSISPWAVAAVSVFHLLFHVLMHSKQRNARRSGVGGRFVLNDQCTSVWLCWLTASSSREKMNIPEKVEHRTVLGFGRKVRRSYGTCCVAFTVIRHIVYLWRRCSSSLRLIKVLFYLHRCFWRHEKHFRTWCASDWWNNRPGTPASPSGPIHPDCQSSCFLWNDWWQI